VGRIDDANTLGWVVESSADGVVWERLWIGTAGCFTLAHARQVARSCQAAHDILEWTCGLPPKTWRVRNVHTGAFIVGDDAPDGRH